jgi:hypothetical protein
VRFIGGGQYRAAATSDRVWKCAGTTAPPEGGKLPETETFHRPSGPEEEISTAVDEAVEYLGKALETA